MPTIFIDNKPFEVKAGKNLLEACLSLGLDLPYFCWHPALGSVGACRQCAISMFKDENDQKGKLTMACMEGVKDGLRISLTDTTSKAFREQVVEWLMTNHPHDCPVCDEGGSCHLQDMTVMTGHDYRRFSYKKRTYKNQYLGPFIHHEMNRCIQCYRCVRFYKDYAGGKDLDVFAAHNHVYFGREKDGVLESPFSGNLAEVCPTGVFTDETLRQHYTRKWDLTMAPSVCTHCSLGCNITAGERYGELRSITNRYNGDVNGYFLCDRGRFGYEFVNSENRIAKPIIRNRVGEAVDEDTLMTHLKTIFKHGNKFIGIGSPRASVESNYALMDLVGKDNYYNGLSEFENLLAKLVAKTLQSGTVRSASLKDVEKADAVLILGEDVWNTAPMLALSVRQAVLKSAAAEALQQTPLPQWHDAAIRELVQEERGYFANITLAGSALDEIANYKLHSSPDDIARLGYAIAHIIDPGSPAVKNASDELLTKAKEIADALLKAKNPVIISGTGCLNEPLIKAAHNIALALNSGERKAEICYVMHESNTMGLALTQAFGLDKAIERTEREEGLSVVILENDLYRSLPGNVVDRFLSRCKNVVVLDQLNNATTVKAHVLIPSATFAEADGTMVNNEGRAQSFFQVFNPASNYVREAWRWLYAIKDLNAAPGNETFPHPDEILSRVEKDYPMFSGISKVSPAHDFRVNGQRIPREPRRYSGRTAIRANISVSEPRPFQDDDSPLSYTMEGYDGIPPSSLIPFFWSPGWNSIQSVNKYQDEVGGALKGGDPGVRLFEVDKSKPKTYFEHIPYPFTAKPDHLLLLPQFHVFGSGELSIYTKAIEDFAPEPYAALSEPDAEKMGLSDGSILNVKIGEKKIAFPVCVHKAISNGIVLLPAGLTETAGAIWGAWINFSANGHS
ncbi:MAG: NADH-quinone oxidoreductase subunit G [Bacteroidetes bacterium]|nr:MAG: NADH-quinone oxidoreductase subunit G [Bacteroidota bacterium]